MCGPVTLAQSPPQSNLRAMPVCHSQCHICKEITGLEVKRDIHDAASAGQPWARHFPFLSLGFLIFKKNHANRHLFLFM